MSRRVVATSRLVSTSNTLRHDGRGPLVLLCFKVSHDPLYVVMQACYSMGY